MREEIITRSRRSLCELVTHVRDTFCIYVHEPLRWIATARLNFGWARSLGSCPSNSNRSPSCALLFTLFQIPWVTIALRIQAKHPSTKLQTLSNACVRAVTIPVGREEILCNHKKKASRSLEISYHPWDFEVELETSEISSLEPIDNLTIMPAINPNPLLVANLFGIHGRVAVITGGGTGLGESCVS